MMSLYMPFTAVSCILAPALSPISGAKEELDRILDDTPQGRGSMAHAALMYAVKPNVNALLDVARWTKKSRQIIGPDNPTC